MLEERFPDYWAAIQRQDWEYLGWDTPEFFTRRVIAAWEDLLLRSGERWCSGSSPWATTAEIIGTTARQTSSPPTHRPRAAQR